MEHVNSLSLALGTEFDPELGRSKHWDDEHHPNCIFVPGPYIWNQCHLAKKKTKLPQGKMQKNMNQSGGTSVLTNHPHLSHLYGKYMEISFV